jgi:S1-C subfamily serine protease
VAIGNALDLGATPTVTKGIVSAKNRTLDVDANLTLHGLIQTDAPINPGNSGGPLVNAQGQVVGINSAGIPDAQSVGFAIAINTVKPLINQLKTGGTPAVTPASTAFLGVSLQDAVNGALISGVSSGSGAETAGLQPGDVITQIDSTTIASADDVGTVISSHKPGDKITIHVLRNNQPVTVSATLGSRAG